MLAFVFFIAACWFLLCAWRWKTFAPLLPLFLPTYLVQISVFGVPFTLLEIFVWVTFAVWVMRWLASREEIHFVPRRLLLLLGGFLVVGTIGLLAAPSDVTMIDGTIFPSSRVALGIWKGWVIVGVLAGFLSGSFLRDPASRLRAISAWLGGGLFVSLWALAQVWSGVFLTPDGRASGPFTSANYLSLYIGPMVVAACGLAFESTRRKERAWFLTVLVFLAAALFFSKSYAAWIAVFGAVFLYFILCTPRWRVAGGLVAIVLSFFALERGAEKFQQLFDFTERSSSAVRLEVWQIALQLIAENPFAGIGLGQFPAFYQTNAVRILGHVPYEWVMLHPHNIFLAMWLFTGLLGVLWFLWFVWLLCVTGYHALRHHALRLPVRRMIVLFTCVLLAIVVHGLFDTPLWKNDLMVSFWFLTAFLFSL